MTSYVHVIDETHCKLRCDRHRKLHALCNRTITDASQGAVRQSSQHVRTRQAQERFRNLHAHCNLSITDALQQRCDRNELLRAIADTSLVSCATCPIHCKCRRDCHELVRAIADASQVAWAIFLMLRKCKRDSSCARSLMRRKVHARHV